MKTIYVLWEEYFNRPAILLSFHNTLYEAENAIIKRREYLNHKNLSCDSFRVEKRVLKE